MTLTMEHIKILTRPIPYLLIVVLYVGCGVHPSSVVTLGNGNYGLSKKGRSGYVTISSIEKKAVIEAQAFAKTQKKQIEFVSKNITPAGFGVFPQVDLVFRLRDTAKAAIEKTFETESSLREYFDTNALDEIEGIYKSYQSVGLKHYLIGIKKYNEIFKAIILESEIEEWKAGEVKAEFEPSSMKGLYSTKWFSGDKLRIETFSHLKTPSILEVEFKDPQSGEKRKDKFIKMYPPINASSSKEPASGGMKGSGSGIVISANGIIATNAHVIEGASRLAVNLSTDLGTVEYPAKLLLKDEANDVALLKIISEDFKGFNPLPYNVVHRSEIGEDVFTIGFPMNKVMGENYKVTDGIISSNTGIKDDVRYIQTTTPIQPGNSGGPLFNKDGNVIGLTTSRLNENAVGTSVQNVNFAIKAVYLTNLYDMLPDKGDISSGSSLKGMSLSEQVKVLKNYVCLIKVY